MLSSAYRGGGENSLTKILSEPISTTNVYKLKCLGSHVHLADGK